MQDEAEMVKQMKQQRVDEWTALADRLDAEPSQADEGAERFWKGNTQAERAANLRRGVDVLRAAGPHFT